MATWKRNPARLWAILCTLGIVAFTAFAGTRIYWGPGLAQCLDVTGDASSSGWSVTGSASHFGAIDEQDGACLTANDGLTSYIECAASTQCDDVFTLEDTSGLSGKRILYVAGFLDCRRGAGTAKGGAISYLRISGSDYQLAAPNCTSSSFNSGVGTPQYTNPHTGAEWTTADIDAMQLKVSRASTQTSPQQVSSAGVCVAYEEPENYSTERERHAGGN